MHKVLTYAGTIVFIPLFSLLMIGGDLLQRLLACKRSFWLALYRGLNRSVLFLLSTCCGMRVVISDRTEGDSKDTASQQKSVAIIVSNHQSLMDLPLVIKAFPQLMIKFISKVQLSNGLPYVSYQLRLMPHCLIERGNRGQAITAIKEFVTNHIAGDDALVIFPEGTRAKEGQIKPFKPGGLLAAVNHCTLELRRPVTIYPLAIQNSYQLSRHKLLPVPWGVKIRLSKLPPLLVKSEEELTVGTINDLQIRIAQCLQE